VFVVSFGLSLNRFLTILQFKEKGLEFDKEFPEGSFVHDTDRANEKYDSTESDLRVDVATANVYNVFIRYIPVGTFFRKYQNDLLKGNRFAVCKKCKWFISYGVLVFIDLSIGQAMSGLKLWTCFSSNSTWSASAG
jgi:hypothetical protein